MKEKVEEKNMEDEVMEEVEDSAMTEVEKEALQEEKL